MRLTCPNCGAQYEVPDDVIPESGRDVQCSNCGDTWFQTHPDHAAGGNKTDPGVSGQNDWDDETPAGDNVAAEFASSPAPERPSDTPPVPPAAEDFAAPPAAPAGRSASGEAKSEPSRIPPSKVVSDARAPRTERPERREIDPNVANVLREEADREKRARVATQSGLETQSDLGLDGDEARRAREARLRMARMRGEDGGAPDHSTDEDDGDEGIDPTSRRSLFPDIEEINSSLSPQHRSQAAASAYDPYPEVAPRPRGGFRRGFLLALLIAVCALLAYMFAVQLADMLPALQGVLVDYVAWVDGLRQWLDGQMAAAMLWLDGLIGVSPAPGGS